MRLIHTKTLKLRDFTGRVPPYAILSHRWVRGEVSHADFHNVLVRHRRLGYSKIRAACAQARQDGLEYLWVDTCCIDKSSSAELGEAINSMFKWYQRAALCYAHLDDVTANDGLIGLSQVSEQKVEHGYRNGYFDARRQIEFERGASAWERRNGGGRRGGGDGPFGGEQKTATTNESNDYHDRIAGLFTSSRWFTRGWTLQELIAPSKVHFYDRHWHKLGEKSALIQPLKRVTGIDASVLEGGPLRQISVGRRMSWASNRVTTRIEDLAYCLLGIFDVNMPMLYGEGTRAFTRLQEEILKQSDDQTLLAWQCSAASARAAPVRGLLASSPADFANFRPDEPVTFRAPALFGEPASSRNRVYESQEATIVPFRDFNGPENPVVMTSRGIRVTSVVEDLRPTPMDFVILGLNCSVGGGLTKVVGIYLQRHSGDRYVRVRPDELGICPSHGSRRTIYGLKTANDIAAGPEESMLGSGAIVKPLRSPAAVDGHEMRTNGLPRSRSAFQHAFYLASTTMPTQWATYYVSKVFSAGASSDVTTRGEPEPGSPENTTRMWQHNLGPDTSHNALLFETDWKARNGQFRGGILLKAGLANATHLIILGARWGAHDATSYTSWFDVVTFPDRASTPSDEEIAALTMSAQPPTVAGAATTSVTGSATFTAAVSAEGAPSVLGGGGWVRFGEEKEIPLLPDGSKALLISVTPGKVQGLDMFNVNIRGKLGGQVLGQLSDARISRGLVVVAGRGAYVLPVTRIESPNPDAGVGAENSSPKSEKGIGKGLKAWCGTEWRQVTREATANGKETMYERYRWWWMH